MVYDNACLAIHSRVWLHDEATAMGCDKDQEIEEEEQGWRYSNKSIYYRCFTDPYLRRRVETQADRTQCDFCEHTRGTPE